MNVDLYSRIKNEISNIVDQINLKQVTKEEVMMSLLYAKKSLDSIRKSLIDNMDKCKSTDDQLALLYAFYEQIEVAYDKFASNDLAFANMDPKTYQYFKSLSNFLRTLEDDLRSTFNKMLEPDGNLEKVISSTKTVIPLMTAIHKMGSSLLLKKLDENEQLAKDKLNQKLTSNALTADPAVERLNKVIVNEEEKAAELKKKFDEQQAKANALKEKRKDVLFDKASEVLDVNKQELVKAVEKATSLDIGNIAISNKLLKELRSEDRKVCSMPMTFLDNLEEKLRRKRFVGSLEFDVEKINNVNVLKIRKKDKFFDKIASGKRPIMEAVIKSAQRKCALIKNWIQIDSELIAKIKASIIERNNQYKQNMNEPNIKNNTFDISVDEKPKTEEKAPVVQTTASKVITLDDEFSKYNKPSFSGGTTQPSEPVKENKRVSMGDKFKELIDSTLSQPALVSQKKVFAYDMKEPLSKKMEDFYSDSSLDPKNKQKEVDADDHYDERYDTLAKESAFGKLTDEEFNELLKKSSSEIPDSYDPKKM